MRNPISKDTSQTRHGLFAVDQSRLLVMRESDPAAVEGRTRYPTTIVHIEDTQTSRPLISGHNNPKLGRLVKTGPWEGARIYHLSLEERATCPRTCNMWHTCYGNSMPFAKRRAYNDALLDAIDRQLTELTSRGTIALRLHTLGDFPDLQYVQFWCNMMAKHLKLHVFGYTARTGEIGQQICSMNETYEGRWVIRRSNHNGALGTIVVLDKEEINQLKQTNSVIPCPAKYGTGQNCGMCNMCWDPKFHNSAIAFTLHGPKKRGPTK